MNRPDVSEKWKVYDGKKLVFTFRTVYSDDVGDFICIECRSPHEKKYTFMCEVMIIEDCGWAYDAVCRMLFQYGYAPMKRGGRGRNNLPDTWQELFPMVGLRLEEVLK